MIMKKYTEFIKRTYDEIAKLYEGQEENICGVFAEGVQYRLQKNHQECAILLNEEARVFVAVVQKYLELLEISDTEYQLKHSPIQGRFKQFSKAGKEEVKIAHSCYPKNLRRWATGTVSRKKKCRIEFCVLVWCHANGWSLLPNKENEKLNTCRQNLKKICMDYLPQEDILQKELSFDMLWKASRAAYCQSF